MDYIKVEKSACTLCGGCVAVCPKKIILLHKDFLEFKEDCIKCDRCIKVCPAGALTKNE